MPKDDEAETDTAATEVPKEEVSVSVEDQSVVDPAGSEKSAMNDQVVKDEE